jgi:acetyl esterase/lipase
MRRLKALTWATLSALSGLLSIWPTVSPQGHRRLALAQTLVTEDPFLGLLAGWLGVWHGLWSRSWRAVLLGCAGLLLRLRPWQQREAVARQMADAMREGLGHGWQQRIPPVRQRAFAQTHRTDLIGPLWRAVWPRVQVTHDVLFAIPDGYPLRLDVYAPARASELCPAILALHGGMWFTGDKGGFVAGLRYRWLASQGYVVFDAQYRRGGPWPAPLSDVKCALRWIRANGAGYGADAARLAILGHGAGAHLALLAAYTPGDPRFPPGCLSKTGFEPDERVQAVIVCAPPADLRLWPPLPDGAPALLLGGLPADIPEVYEAAAPVNHVRADVPPTLIIQGQRDRTVPPAHAELLANRLRAAGATVVLLRIPWGRHDIGPLPVGMSGPLIQYDVDRFLAWAFACGTRAQPIGRENALQSD